MKLKLLLTSVSLAFALLLSEAIIRLLIGPPAAFLYTDSFRDRQSDWNIVYGVDEQHHRMACVHWDGKAAKVAVIGDSFVFGQGVADCKDFSALLNRQQQQYYYVNLGVIGIGPNEYLQIARDLVGDDYKEVVLLFYGNDWLDMPPTLMQTLVSHSSLLSLLQRIRRQRITSQAIGDAMTSGEPWNNIKATLAEKPDYALRMVEPDAGEQMYFSTAFKKIIATLAAKVGKEHIYIALAPAGSTVSGNVRHFVEEQGGKVAEFGREGRAYGQLKALCQQAGVQFIDTWPSFMEHGEWFYHPHDFHWNAAGHRKMSELLLPASE